MRKIWSGVVLGAMILSAGAVAHAEPWDQGYRPAPAGYGQYGYGQPGYGGYGYGYGYGDARLAAVCNGATARRLEGLIYHEAGEGELDADTANWLHRQIDGLEDKARHECAEGDQHGIWKVAGKYDRVAETIAQRTRQRWGY